MSRRKRYSLKAGCSSVKKPGAFLRRGRGFAGGQADRLDLVDQLAPGDRLLQALHGQRHRADVAHQLRAGAALRFRKRAGCGFGFFRREVLALLQAGSGDRDVAPAAVAVGLGALARDPRNFAVLADHHGHARGPVRQALALEHARFLGALQQLLAVVVQSVDHDALVWRQSV
jgi:hypothetical protein